MELDDEDTGIILGNEESSFLVTSLVQGIIVTIDNFITIDNLFPKMSTSGIR